MNIALVGFGIENQAAYRYLSDQGHKLTICDQNPAREVPVGAEAHLGRNYLKNLDQFDQIIRTSGLRPKLITDVNPKVKDKITTAINLFFEACKTPIIGVTGTKGKGTTSTLITKILEASGKKVVLGGNIGIPALDLLDKAKKADYAVLELSSFQLQDIKYSPHIGVCLMVVPEHLDWHPNFKEYKAAKANLFRFQKATDTAVFNGLSAASREIASVSKAKSKLSYAVSELVDQTPSNGYDAYVEDDKILWHDEVICDTDEVSLLGRHNLENVCAAIAATWKLIDGDKKVITKVVSGFTGLPHRLEFVRQFNGVRYYDDSFSTTPETAIAAIKAFKEPKVLILGGSDKGVAFNSLADTVVRHKVRHVLTIGKTGPTIAKLLRARGFKAITDKNLDNMRSIITTAHGRAEVGDIVLLSTGCASFGMFKNYKDRGEQFKVEVNALKAR